MNWKNNLLSSSVPLEYEAAKIVESLGFEVDFEYTYSRINESGIQVDFSVDLFLRKRIPTETSDVMLIIPVECKYRTPDTQWLFLPDLTPEEEQNIDFYPFITEFSEKPELRYGDVFMYLRCSKKVVRGIEIKGDYVYDKEIRHGIQQLKYSLPKAAIDSLFDFKMEYYIGECYIGDCFFIIVPILLTTANLYIANDYPSICTIQESEGISKIAKEVSDLIFMPSPSLDYQMHCKRTMQIYKGLSIPKSYQSKEIIKVGNYSKILIDSVANPIISICNFEYFRDLLNVLITYIYNDLKRSDKNQQSTDYCIKKTEHPSTSDVRN